MQKKKIKGSIFRKTKLISSNLVNKSGEKMYSDFEGPYESDDSVVHVSALCCVCSLPFKIDLCAVQSPYQIDLSVCLSPHVSLINIFRNLSFRVSDFYAFG